MPLSPSRNNIETAGIAEWAIKAEGDSGYAVFPFLRYGEIEIEALYEDDTQARPQPYAYQLSILAEFLPVLSLLTNPNFLINLSTKLINHRIKLIGGGYISSAPLTSTPSPTGFGVKWKFVADKDSESVSYFEMMVSRRLLLSEYIQILTSANVDLTAAIATDTFYSFSNLSRTDIIPAGVSMLKLGANASPLVDVVETMRNAKFIAELQTTEDARGGYIGHSVKVDFECEPLETEEVENLKWPVIVGRTNFSKIVFVGGMISNLSTKLGFKYSYISDSDMQNTAHGKIMSAGVISVQEFVTSMTPHYEFQVDTGGTLTVGLEAYYPLSDVNDRWGTNHLTNAKGISGNFVPFVAGKVGNCASFDGSGNYLYSITPATLAVNNFSAAMWVYLATASRQGAFFHNGYGASDGWNLGVGASTEDAPGNNALALADGVGWMNFVQLIGVGWHFLVLERAAGVWKIYVDSVLGAYNPPSYTPNPPAGIIVGADTFSPVFPRYVQADVDELGIWNKVLTQTEINDLYNGGVGQTLVLT